MKKFFISLNLIFLLNFFTINLAYCEEDFFMNSNFEKAKDKSNLVEKIKDKAKDVKDYSFKKIGLFSKNKKEDDEEKGYYGELPNIDSEFEYKRQNSKPTNKIEAKIPNEEDLLDENLKQAPVDDSLFLDVIIKKEQESDYVKDLQRTKYALSSLKDCIEGNYDIQRFNGCVNLIDLYTQNLKKKYQGKTESYKESYIEILQTNYYAKVLGNLIYDSNYYSRYVPTSQGKYSKENISNEKRKLLNRVNKTLFLINSEL